MQEETPSPHVVKIKGIGASGLRRKAEFYLRKVIIFTVLQASDATIKGEKQAASIIEHYLLAQYAQDKHNEQDYERHLLDAVPNKLAAKDLAELYLEKARHLYMRAGQKGDDEARVIADGLRKYSIIGLLTGEKVFNSVVDDPQVAPLYS